MLYAFLPRTPLSVQRPYATYSRLPRQQRQLRNKQLYQWRLDPLLSPIFSPVVCFAQHLFKTIKTPPTQSQSRTYSSVAHSIPFDRGALRSTSLSIRRYRGTDYPIALTTRFNAWFLVQWLHRCLPGDLLRYSKCNFIYYYNSSLFPSRGFVVPP